MATLLSQGTQIRLANGWSLRLRQAECHDKLINAYLTEGVTDFIIAAVCRFGKTITALASVRDLATELNYESQIVVIISTMNVSKEWYDGAVAVGFDGSLIGHYEKTVDGKEIFIQKEINSVDLTKLPTTGRVVIYVSTQKLGNGSIQSQAIIDAFNKHEGLKTLIYDECHIGSGTERTIKEIVEKLDYDNRVYLSGTPYTQYLKKEFELDSINSDSLFKYTLSQEAKDYQEGVIKDYIPVKLEMHILDMSDKMSKVKYSDKDIEDYGSESSAYFKHLFTDDNLKTDAVEFVNNFIAFCIMHRIKNCLWFVPRLKVGEAIIKNVAKKFADKITFLDLGSDEDDSYQKNVNGLNSLYEESDGKLKIGITVNKCGTGSTMPKLECVAFLKDTTNAAPFIQKSQRPRTPIKGKEVGYVVCFNKYEGLEAYREYARKENEGETKTIPQDGAKKPQLQQDIEEFIKAGAVKLFLDLKEINSYELAIDIENTYMPGKNLLFADVDFLEWVDQMNVELFAETKERLKKEHPEIDFDDAQTLNDLVKKLKDAGEDKEAEDLQKRILTKEQLREMFERGFVDIVSNMLMGYDVEEVIAMNYDEVYWEDIEYSLCTRDMWKYMLSSYPHYVTMIYNYLNLNW